MKLRNHVVLGAVGALMLIGSAVAVTGGRQISLQGTFLQSGSGATLRTIESKLRDTISVCDYIGAACPSGGNDTTAIQAAVTAAAGKKLRFPAGTYTITAKITVPSNSFLISDGATINQTTQGEIVFYGTAVSNVTITGFTLTGAGSQYVPASSDNWGAITFETSGGGIFVTQNKISGFWNGIVGQNLTGLQTRDNDISAFRYFGILSSQTSDFSHDSNTIHDNEMPTVQGAWSAVTTYSLGQTVTSGGLAYMSLVNGNLNHTPPVTVDAFWHNAVAYGISANGPTGHSPPQTRNAITSNVIRNIPFWAGIMSHDNDGVVIANNQIRNVRAGLDLGSISAGNYIDKMVISGNYIEDTTTDCWATVAANNSGIYLYGFDATTNRGRNISVTGNTISGFNGFNFGSSPSGAIVAQNVDGLSISGNRVFNTQTFANANSAGIVLNGGIVNDISITGNSVTTGNGLKQIYIINATSNAISISGNTLMDGNNSAYSIRVFGSTIVNLNVQGNISRSAGYYFGNTNTITWENVDWNRTITPLLGVSSQLNNTTVPTQTGGSGAPGVDEPIGSVWHRTNAGPSLYLKEATGTAGWAAAVAVPGTPVALTAQTANLAATNVYAAAPGGEYRVCATARTTTSGTGTTANLNIIWTDEGGVKTDAVGTWALNSVTVTGQINKCEYIHAAATTNIQVSVTAGTYGTSVYAISATVERLN